MTRIPPPDEAAHEDGRMMHELSKVNTQLSRYLLLFLDADAGRAEPVSVEQERALADRLAAVAAALQARAARRERHADRPAAVEGRHARHLLDAARHTEE